MPEGTEGGEMIDFADIPNEIDKECWTLDFAIPPGVGARRITVVHDHGEKKVYVDGELYLTFSKKVEGAKPSLRDLLPPRCPSISPASKEQCALPEDHKGGHHNESCTLVWGVPTDDSWDSDDDEESANA